MEEDIIQENIVVFVEDLAKEQIGNHPKDQIEKQIEDPTKNEDSIENREEEQILDFKEATQKHTTVPETRILDIAISVK